MLLRGLVQMHLATECMPITSRRGANKRMPSAQCTPQKNVSRNETGLRQALMHAAVDSLVDHLEPGTIQDPRSTYHREARRAVCPWARRP